MTYARVRMPYSLLTCFVDTQLDGRIPANLSQRSGILSYQVHQLADLVSTSVRANGNVTKEKERSKEAALPSSYVRVFINDELVLRTGVKPFSAAPYINMESEYFLRSWLEARIHFVVMDSIEGDHDVVIGGVTLELRELLSKTSQSTRYASSLSLLMWRTFD